MMFMTRYAKHVAMIVLMALVTLAAACAPTIQRVAPSSQPTLATNVGSDNNAGTTTAEMSPPVDTIKATLLRDAPLFADAKSSLVFCMARAGDAVLQRFSSGRYAIDLSIANRCVVSESGNSNVSEKLNVTSLWANASDVDFNDAALAPSLVRVDESAQIRVDMAYAGRKIFCTSDHCKINEPLYGKARCYAAPAVADALKRAGAMLVAHDASARLLILDCYRPINVQIEMFERVNDPVWVARPKPPRYGGHNRGVAIDLTIERNGTPLDMGGAFDAFSDVSNYDAKVVSAAAHANRTLLRDTMIAAGFRPYDAEWWHFSLPINTRAMNFPL
jgi:D-alanyl-D-alanine dipeptidase